MTPSPLLGTYLLGAVTCMGFGLITIAFAWFCVDEDPRRYRDYTRSYRMARGGARLVLATPLWPIAALVILAVAAWHAATWLWAAADLTRKDTP